MAPGKADVCYSSYISGSHDPDVANLINRGNNK